MRSYIEFVSSPTSDTPGTLLMLHYDDRRYLVGNLSEGTSRACLQHGLGLRKVNEVLLTGRTRWSNIGGLLGMVLGLADMKIAAAGAQAEHEQIRLAERGKRESQNPQKLTKESSKAKANDNVFLRVHGPPNLNYAIATARRFVFRTGMPIDAITHSAISSAAAEDEQSIPPTWTDERLKVWCMPVKPLVSFASNGSSCPERPGSRKRSFDMMQEGHPDTETVEGSLPKHIVQQMFDSDWRMDKLVSKSLQDVEMPATIFIRDPSTRQLIPYTGILPGAGRSVPDINVLVRQPWPAALTEALPPTEPAQESISYIIRNHPQRGKFLPKKAEELQVPRGSLWRNLTEGHSVDNLEGQEITPDMVLEPGKQGGGFAIVELPSVDYIDGLLARREWSDQSVMDGIGAFVWILGAGVFSDSRLAQFRDQYQHVKHIVASPDVREDGLALETAAKSAWSHHDEEPAVFPKLVVDNTHLTSHFNRNTSDEATNIIAAQRGLAVALEPKVELELDRLVSYATDSSLTSRVKKEHNSMLAEADHLSSSTVLTRISDTSSGSSWYTTTSYANIEITTLGTGSSHPSTHRNVSSTLVRIPDHGSYIFDCGEGTLGSLRRMYTKPALDALLADLRMIWISHMHADHHLGTTSVIRAWYDAVHSSNPGPEMTTSDFDPLKDAHQRLAIVSDAPMLHWLREYSSVEDYGYSRLLPLATQPTRSATDPAHATPTGLRLAVSPNSIAADRTPTDAYLHAIGLTSLSTVFVPHCRGAQAISCTFPLPSPAPDFKLSYSGDTRPSTPFARIGANSDVLIHEATFDNDMRAEARAKKHSTAGEALVVAREMNAKAVVLTHFSQRYPKMVGAGVPVGGDAANGIGGKGGTPKPKEAGEELNMPLEGPLGDAPTAPETADAVDFPPDETQDPLEAQPSSAPGALPLTSPPVPAVNLSDTYYALQRRPGGIAGAVAEASIKVVPAFDYMRLRLGDLDKAVQAQGVLRGVEEFADRKRVMKKEDNLRGEEGKKKKGGKGGKGGGGGAL